MYVDYGLCLHVISLPEVWSWSDRTGCDWETSLDIRVSVVEEKSKTETHGGENNPLSGTFYFKEYGLITKFARTHTLATKCGKQRH